MADVFSKEKRSEVMSRIRSSNTAIERLVFASLRSKKIYFQKHYKRAAGKPDIAIPRKKLAVFIDGDFWHGRDYSVRKKRLPEYWRNKIESNMRRDRRHRRLLKKQGWKTIRVWEHDLEKKAEKTLEKIAAFLAGPK